MAEKRRVSGYAGAVKWDAELRRWRWRAHHPWLTALGLRWRGTRSDASGSPRSRHCWSPAVDPSRGISVDRRVGLSP